MARYRWLISICITISFMQYFCDVQTKTTQSQTTYEEITMEEQTSEVTTDAGLTETTVHIEDTTTATDGLASTPNGITTIIGTTMVSEIPTGTTAISTTDVATNMPAATLTTANVSLSTDSQTAETTQSQTTYEETTMEEQTSEVTTDAGLTETTGGKMTATDGLASTSNGVAMNTPAATLTTANVSLSTMSQIVLTSTLPTITEGEITSMATKPLITPGVSIATNMVTDEAHTIPITAELSTTIVSMTKTDSPELTNATSTSKRTTQEEVTTNLFIPSTMEVITKAISTASPKQMTEGTTTEVATSLLTLPENLTTYDLPMSTTAGFATKDVTQTLSTGIEITNELQTSVTAPSTTATPASPNLTNERRTSELTSLVTFLVEGTTLLEGLPSTASSTTTTITSPKGSTKRSTSELVTSKLASPGNGTTLLEGSPSTASSTTTTVTSPKGSTKRSTSELVTSKLASPGNGTTLSEGPPSTASDTATSITSSKGTTKRSTSELVTSTVTAPVDNSTMVEGSSSTASSTTTTITSPKGSTKRSTSELITSMVTSPVDSSTMVEGSSSTASRTTATSSSPNLTTERSTLKVEELTVTTPRITTKASPPTSGRTTNEVVTSLYTSDNNVTLFTEPQMDTTEADFYPSSSLPPSPETVTERSELTITTSASVPTSRKSAACTRSSDCPQEKQVCVQRTNTCDCRPGLYYRDRDCIGIAFFVTHISLDVLFDEDLNDRTSNAFMNLQEEICEEITNIMLGNTSTLRAVFLGCYVNSFMNGSVIADIVTEYSTEITVVAADVTKMLGGLKSTGLNLTITWNITSEVFQLQHCSTGNNVCHENVSTCSDIKEMNGYECSCKDGFIDQDSVPGMYCIEEVDQGAVGGRYATVVGLALAVLFVVIILLSCIILLAKRIVKTKAEMTMDIPLSELPVHLTSKRRLTDFVPYPAGAKGTDEVDGYPTPDYPADGYANENGRKVKSRVMGDSVENVSYIPFEGGDDVNSTDSILYY